MDFGLNGYVKESKISLSIITQVIHPVNFMLDEKFQPKVGLL
jgi:hypothetical protein